LPITAEQVKTSVATHRGIPVTKGWRRTGCTNVSEALISRIVSA
jgi:hypothetical protein